MIFKTISSKLEKPNYDISINNIDCAYGHWGDENKIIAHMSKVEDFIYDSDKLDENVLSHCLGLVKANRRIKNIRFFRIPDENKIICLALSEVHRFKKPEILSREMNITFKKKKFSFSIIELLEDEEKEMKKDGKAMPDSWQSDEKLNKRFDMLKNFQ